MNRREFNISMLAGAGLVAAPGIARSQNVYNLKLGHFISPNHIFAEYLQRWVDELKKTSSGKLNITIFPANTMGPVQNYVDYARTGVADITWYLAGATPGRFPLTEIIQLPFMAGSAEIGTKTLNDPDVLKLIEREHQGLKILYLLTHQPGNLHTSAKPVNTVEDMKGLRIRFASVTIKSFIAALGGTPVGVPPSGIADALQKNTIDGCFVDYGGAHTAFRLGGLVKYTTEMYSYVSSFGVVMNPASFARLPAGTAEADRGHHTPTHCRNRQVVGFGRRSRQEVSGGERRHADHAVQGTGHVVQENRGRRHGQSSGRARYQGTTGHQSTRRHEGCGREGLQDVVLILESVNGGPGCVCF